MIFLTRCLTSLLLIAPTAVLAQSEAEGNQPAAGDGAVQPATATPRFTVGQLLARGFDVKSMTYDSGSFLLILQAGNDAFLCETSINGTTKACVTLK